MNDFDEIELKACLDNGYPYFHKLQNFVDDRGWSLMNLFKGNLSGGQVNVSSIYSGVVKAWHRHHKQVDFWIPIRGTLKCAVYNPDKEIFSQFIFGEKNPGVLAIPKGSWHGMSTVGDEIATLLYYVTEEYNLEDPDEERLPPNAHKISKWNFPDDFSWSVVHK
jgi:dTDP-4-dehydrorhamnose 3,5-epimerase